MISVMNQEIIIGEKVTLRSVEKEDLETLWTLIYGEEDPEFKKWDAPYFPLEKVDLNKYVTEMSRQIDEGLEDMKLIIVNEEIIGTVTYYWEHRPSNWMEFGVIIYKPEFWSGGYGSEACKLWVDYLFETYAFIPRLGFTTWSGNIRMMKVGEKLGMVEEARIRKCRLYNGTYYDSIKMGMLREEWESLTKN